MAPGNCLRVQTPEAEIFPQRVSFWKFHFLAWQCLRALASRTKNMCAWVLDPCFIVTKGTIILRTPLESQATVALPTAYLLNPRLRLGNERLSRDYDPWLEVTEFSECQASRKRHINKKPLKVRIEASGVSGRGWARITRSLHSPGFLVALLGLLDHLLRVSFVPLTVLNAWWAFSCSSLITTLGEMCY